MKRAALLLGLFLLFGVSVAFLMSRVVHDPAAPVVTPPEPAPVDTLPDIEPEPPAPPSDSTGTGWHEAPPDSVPPPDPTRPHPGRGRDKEGGSA